MSPTPKNNEEKAPVPLTRILRKAQQILNVGPKGLSGDILSRYKPTSFLLRPSNDLQSQQMVGTYLKAMKDDLKNGGYIFVKRSRAAELLQQLTAVGAFFKVVHFERMEDIADIIDIEFPRELWVIVEDDSLPHETLATRFKVAETALRSKIAPNLGTPIDDQSARKALLKRREMGIRLLMFIEMDYPSLKGFSIVLSQMRGLRVATCAVTRENAYDHTVNGLFGLPAHSPDELKSRAINTVQVFGSGPKNFEQCSEAFHRYLKDEPLVADQWGNETPEETTGIDLERLRSTTNLALVVGFGDPALVDITK